MTELSDYILSKLKINEHLLYDWVLLFLCRDVLYNFSNINVSLLNMIVGIYIGDKQWGSIICNYFDTFSHLNYYFDNFKHNQMYYHGQRHFLQNKEREEREREREREIAWVVEWKEIKNEIYLST